LASAQRVHFALNLIDGHSREENDGQTGTMFVEVIKNGETVEAGHEEVEDQEIDGTMFEMEQGGFTVGGLVHGEGMASEEVGQG